MNCQSTAIVIAVLTLGFASGIWSCSSGGAQDDGGTTDADGLDGSEEDGDSFFSDSGVDAADVDIGDATLLVIPAGASLCSTFYGGRTLGEETRLLGKIDLRPGSYRLARVEGLTDADFISGIQIGRDRISLVPVAAGGEFEAEYLAAGEGAGWHYHFHQEYVFEDEPFRVKVDIELPDEVEWPEVITADRTFLSERVLAEATIGPGTLEDEIQAFGSCDPIEVIHRFDGTAQNGDRIELEVRRCAGCPVCGPPPYMECRYPFSNRVTLSGHERLVDDPFGLVYACGPQHNGCEQFLTFLDPPMDGASALLVHVPDWCWVDGWLIYLDEGLEEIRREPVTDWQVIP